MNGTKNNFLFVLGILYCLVFGYLLFAASFRKDTLTEINIIPFKTLYTDLRLAIVSPPSSHYIIYALGGVLGNLLLLFPVPVFFQLTLKRWKIWAFAIFTPFVIEALQYFLQVGSADIDDVILNAIGAYLGVRFAQKF